MQQAIVYTIIVTYNGMQWIERCLNSLIASSYASHIVVIDNGSKDSTVPFIKEKYEGVELIETGKNVGFGQGNNIGLRLALSNNADHIFLLNQDAWVEEDTICQLVEVQKMHPAFGIVSPIHLNGAGTDFDDHFFEYFKKSDIRDMLLTSVFGKKKEVIDEIIATPFVNAAAWLISKDCLQKTGGFDPIFFHYGEDDNYANRVLFKGFKIGILLNAKICHDKERPIIAKPNIVVKFKKDWIIFLDHACNLQRSNYIFLMVKRFFRHTILTILSFFTFRKENIFYNFSMAKSIFFSFIKVTQSRRICINTQTPYL